MATEDARIITTLPIASWRGLLLPPHKAAPLKVEHRLPERKWGRVDIAGHDYVGTDYGPMSFELRFLNTIPQRATDIVMRMFPDYWQTFIYQLLDGRPGDLVHPLLGTVRARVHDWHTEATEQNISGIIVHVTWVRTNEHPEEDTEALLFDDIASPAQLAAQADAAAAELGVVVAPGRLPEMSASMYGIPVEELVEESLTLEAIWASISVGFGLLNPGFLTALSSLLADIQAMVASLEALDDWLTFPALDACRRFHRYVNTAAASLRRASRPRARRTLTAETTLDAFTRDVAKYGNTLEDVMALNLRYIHLARVPQNTVLWYYTSV